LGEDSVKEKDIPGLHKRGLTNREKNNMVCRYLLTKPGVQQ